MTDGRFAPWVQSGLSPAPVAIFTIIFPSHILENGTAVLWHQEAAESDPAQQAAREGKGLFTQLLMTRMGLLLSDSLVKTGGQTTSSLVKDPRGRRREAYWNIFQSHPKNDFGVGNKFCLNKLYIKVSHASLFITIWALSPRVRLSKMGTQVSVYLHKHYKVLQNELQPFKLLSLSL